VVVVVVLDSSNSIVNPRYNGLMGGVVAAVRYNRVKGYSRKHTTGYIVDKKYKAIPVTGCGGPWGSETSRLPHFLDNRLTDGGQVASLTRLPPFTPKKIPGTHYT
jgi:hypothetical protein